MLSYISRGGTGTDSTSNSMTPASVPSFVQPMPQLANTSNQGQMGQLGNNGFVPDNMNTATQTSSKGKGKEVSFTEPQLSNVSTM